MERCGFFDAHLVGNEYDRVYLAEQFASYFASFVGNGVFGKKLNELQVLSMTTPAMQIRVQEGQGWINGYWYENMSELYLPIEVADGVLSRIDSVVLRLGITERSMWIAVKKGTPSYEPVAPDITRNDDYYELQLATIWIGAGYTNIKQSDITDTRWNADACGVVAGLIEQLDTSDYGYQLQSFIDQYTAKSRVDYENYVANLEKLKADATQDKNNYFADLQSLYKLCDDAYQEFLAYLADLKNNGDASLESLKSWIESLKQSSSTEINRLIEELRGLISEEMVSDLILRLTDLEQEMPKKIPLPVDSNLTEGIVYLNSDGTTKLIEDREQLKKFKYSIIVDNGVDGNPAAIEYADDCINFIEAYGSNMGDWAHTDLYRKYFRPCVIGKEDSEPKYFLQQDNMTLKEDGTPAVLDGTDGDVMIQVGKLYGKVIKLENKFKLTILNYKEDDSCFCFNKIDGEEKDYIYIAAFTCFYSYNNEEKSFCSRTADFIDISNGIIDYFSTWYTSYNDLYTGDANLTPIPQNYLSGYYYLTYALYQWMFLFLYKSRNAQSVLGPGRRRTAKSSSEPEGSDFVIGCTAEKSFCYGMPDYNDEDDFVEPIKFLGIEDFYGFGSDFICGMFFQKEFLNDTDFTAYFGFSQEPLKYSALYDALQISKSDFDFVADFITRMQVSASGISALVETYLKKVNLDAGILCPFLGQVDDVAIDGTSSETFWCDAVYLNGIDNHNPTCSFYVSATAWYDTVSKDGFFGLGPFYFLFNMYTGSMGMDNTTIRLCRYK